MSYAEQQWTVDQVNEKIQSSDAGKDLYLAGVPRGTPISTSSASLSVTGSGWIFYMSSSHIAQGNTQIIMTVDNDITYQIKPYDTLTATIVFDPNTYDYFNNATAISKNPIFDRGTTKINKPIRFNTGFSCTISVISGKSNGSIVYALDETYNK